MIDCLTSVLLGTISHSLSFNLIRSGHVIPPFITVCTPQKEAITSFNDFGSPVGAASSSSAEPPAVAGTAGSSSSSPHGAIKTPGAPGKKRRRLLRCQSSLELEKVMLPQ